MTVEHDGIDALMAAITDEPLSEEARGDAVFMAEHRSASADLTLLREQLGVIGHALAEPPRFRHRPRFRSRSQLGWVPHVSAYGSPNSPSVGWRWPRRLPWSPVWAG